MTSNETFLSTSHCYDYDIDDYVIVQSAYWFEGVLVCVVGAAGLVGNTVSGLVLSGRTMRNSFNLLLIALAVYDNLYLASAMLEGMRKRLLTEPAYLHVLFFPWFLYPLMMMSMTGSILMTVAIAVER